MLRRKVLRQGNDGAKGPFTALGTPWQTPGAGAYHPNHGQRQSQPRIAVATALPSLRRGPGWAPFAARRCSRRDGAHRPDAGVPRRPDELPARLAALAGGEAGP